MCSKLFHLGRNSFLSLLQPPKYQPAAKTRSTLGSTQPYMLPYLLGVRQELFPNPTLALQGLMGAMERGGGEPKENSPTLFPACLMEMRPGSIEKLQD